MSGKAFFFTCILTLLATIFTGCVERKLTINTVPQGALVELNDEEIGTTPVTVAFNWYGDYNVRIRKEGYNAIDTNKILKQPKKDKFPYDFYYEVLTPKRYVDEYEWTFQLETYTPMDRDELIKAAQNMKKEAAKPLDIELSNMQYELEHGKKKK